MCSASALQAFRASSVSSSFSSGFTFSRKLACDIGERATPTTPTSGARNPCVRRLKIAGTSLRCVKSPEAPKMMTRHGSPTRTSGPLLPAGVVTEPPLHTATRNFSCLPPASGQPLADGFEEVIEGLGELLDTLLHQRVGDGLHGNARLFEVAHDGLRAREVLGQTLPNLSMIAEGVQRRGRDGVHRVRADQFLDVEHVRVLGILGAGAGPQN